MKKYFIINTTDNSIISPASILPDTYKHISNLQTIAENDPELLKDLTWADLPEEGFWEAIYGEQPELGINQVYDQTVSVDPILKVVNVTLTVVQAPEGNVDPRDTLALIKQDVGRYRDEYLFLTDYTQLPDAPFTDDEKAQFATYRQQLRDMFDVDDVNDIAWPTKPDIASSPLRNVVEPGYSGFL